MAICPICGKNETTGRNRVCDSIICREEMKKLWYDEKIAVPDGYLDAAVFAKRNNISRQAVTKNCRNGKYPGAFQDEKSGRWYIPENIKVPAKNRLDRRRKREFFATDREWTQIIEKAAATKYPVVEYILRKTLDKKV